LKYLSYCSITILVGLIAGCRTTKLYQVQSFDSAAILTELDFHGTPPVSNEALTFLQVATWMSDWHPDLQELRAEYAKAEAMAAVVAPRPNPTLKFGLAHGFDTEGEASDTQPFIGFAYAIPMSSRLQDADDLAAAQAGSARVAMVARHRELYLELYTAFIRYGMVHRRMQLFDPLIENARQAIATVEKLTKIGSASGLDVGVLDLDFGLLRLERIELEASVAEARADLAVLTGMPSATFSAVPVTAPPSLNMPSKVRLRQLLIDNNTELARLKAAFQVAERVLHFELARQKTDVEVAAELEQEAGADKREFALGVEIELPIYDRNQQAIAEADQECRLVKARFETALTRSLAHLDVLLERFELIRRRLDVINEELLPKSRSNLKTARRLAEAGHFAALQYLELLRGERELQIAMADAELALLDNEVAVEQLIGVPLVRGPGKSARTYLSTDGPDGTGGVDPGLPSWQESIDTKTPQE